jgi:hypothetical protein
MARARAPDGAGDMAKAWSQAELKRLRAAGSGAGHS